MIILKSVMIILKIIFVSGAGGLRFKSRAGQIDHSVATTATTRHRCDVSSKGAVLPGFYVAEMGPANSLHASAYYSAYNERFDVIILNAIFYLNLSNIFLFKEVYGLKFSVLCCVLFLTF